MGHESEVMACAVTSDGRRVVSASRDKTLRVWELETGRELATLRGHTSQVRACAVMPDGRRVVSASHDKTLKVWDIETGRQLATLRGHAGPVRACAVTPGGRRVVPREGKAVTSWSNQDEAWTDVAKGLRKVVAELQAARAKGP